MTNSFPNELNRKNQEALRHIAKPRLWYKFERSDTTMEMTPNSYQIYRELSNKINHGALRRIAKLRLW